MRKKMEGEKNSSIEGPTVDLFKTVSYKTIFKFLL